MEKNRFNDEGTFISWMIDNLKRDGWVHSPNTNTYNWAFEKRMKRNLSATITIRGHAIIGIELIRGEQLYKREYPVFRLMREANSFNMLLRTMVSMVFERIAMDFITKIYN